MTFFAIGGEAITSLAVGTLLNLKEFIVTIIEYAVTIKEYGSILLDKSYSISISINNLLSLFNEIKEVSSNLLTEYGRLRDFVLLSVVFAPFFIADYSLCTIPKSVVELNTYTVDNDYLSEIHRTKRGLYLDRYFDINKLPEPEQEDRKFLAEIIKKQMLVNGRSTSPWNIHSDNFLGEACALDAWSEAKLYAIAHRAEVAGELPDLNLKMFKRGPRRYLGVGDAPAMIAIANINVYMLVLGKCNQDHKEQFLREYPQFRKHYL